VNRVACALAAVGASFDRAALERWCAHLQQFLFHNVMSPDPAFESVVFQICELLNFDLFRYSAV
jgi:hypothetical protein